MPIHEPLLNVVFGEREEKREEAQLFDFEDFYTILLGNIPDSDLRENVLRNNLGHPVKEVGDHPIEHFHQERKFLQYPAVYMVCETRGIRCADCHSETAISFPRVMLRSSDWVVVFKIVIHEKFV